MIPYEDLVSALTHWRAQEGLPTGAVQFFQADTGSVDLALPVSAPTYDDANELVAEEYVADEYASEEHVADEYVAEEQVAEEYVAEEYADEEQVVTEYATDEYAAADSAVVEEAQDFASGSYDEALGEEATSVASLDELDQEVGYEDEATAYGDAPEQSAVASEPAGLDYADDEQTAFGGDDHEEFSSAGADAHTEAAGDEEIDADGLEVEMGDDDDIDVGEVGAEDGGPATEEIAALDDEDEVVETFEGIEQESTAIGMGVEHLPPGPVDDDPDRDA